MKATSHTLLTGAAIAALLLLFTGSAFAASTTWTTANDFQTGSAAGVSTTQGVSQGTALGLPLFGDLGDLRLGGTVPAWARLTTFDGPAQGNNTYATPALGDIDGDGCVDLLVGRADGTTTAYRNTGSLAVPVWTRQASWDPPSMGAGQYTAPALADLDGDGQMEIAVGRNDQSTYIYDATWPTAANPGWQRIPAWEPPPLSGTSHAAPAFADLNLDGRADLVIGANNDLNLAYENTGGANAPVWTARPSWNPPSEVSRGWTCLAFGDLNGDMLPDLLLGDSRGGVSVYRNTGSRSGPVWTLTSAWNPPQGVSYAAPAVANLDDDRDADLLMGDRKGTIDGMRNTDTGSLADGVWTSGPIDGGAYTWWTEVVWRTRASSAGAGTVAVDLRIAATQVDLGTAAWQPVSSGSLPLPVEGRWAQVRVTFSTSSATATSVLQELTLSGAQDLAPPVTYATPVDFFWHRTPVTLTLVSTDDASGVASTQYRIDGGPWTSGTSVVVAAPSDGSNDGAHVVAYRSTDRAGKTETARTCTVNIGRLSTWVRVIRHRVSLLRVSWDAVAGAVSYDLRVNGVLVGSSSGLTITHRGVSWRQRGTSIHIEVIARDAGGFALQTLSVDQLVR